MADNIQVAVRVRPSKRASADGDDEAAFFEQYGDDSEFYMCVDMPDAQRVRLITRAETDQFPELATEYQFPCCFWSHDRDRSHYATQESIFEQIGRPMLERVFQGFNACMFAYGQTGSGKTYTMQGLDLKEASQVPSEVVEKNHGIIPRVFRELAQDMARLRGVKGARMSVKMSFLEIYNEKIRDLLARQTKRLDMEVRISHQPDGTTLFHRRDGINMQEKTCTYQVSSLEEMEHFYEIGLTHRSVGHTKMNATSSRSHSIVILQVTRRPDMGCDETNAQMFLVDLAGSENAAKTGALGNRLAEAASINTSLLELGNVINKKAKGEAVTTYRNSQLTMILRNAIGGNSYTVMFGAIGPSSYNLHEIKNTLDYCQRASTIQCRTTAHVTNTTASKANIKELEAENKHLADERNELRAQLEAMRSVTNATTDQLAELEEIKAQLQDKETLIERRTLSLSEATMDEEQLIELMRKQAAEQLHSLTCDLEANGLSVGETELPLLVNLHRDHTINGSVQYAVPPDEEVFLGSTAVACRIVVLGFGVRSKHTVFRYSKSSGKLVIEPIAGCETRVNGKAIEEMQVLDHGDRVCFGEYSLFWVDLHQRTGAQPTWQAAMREVSIGRGLFKQDEWAAEKAKLKEAQAELEQLRKQVQREANDQSARERLKEATIAQRNIHSKLRAESQLVEYLEHARVVTRLSAALRVKPTMHFEPIMAAKRLARDGLFEHIVMIKATFTNDDRQTEYLWPTDKFDNLHSYLQELSDRSTDDALDVEEISLNVEQEVGQAVVFLKNLLYLLPVEGEEEGSFHSTQVLSLEGNKIGNISIRVDIDANANDEEEMTLIEGEMRDVLSLWNQWRDEHRMITLAVTIENCEGVPGFVFHNSFVQFAFNHQVCRSEIVHGEETTPQYGYRCEFNVPVTSELIEMLCEDALLVEIRSQPNETAAVLTPTHSDQLLKNQAFHGFRAVTAARQFGSTWRDRAQQARRASLNAEEVHVAELVGDLGTQMDDAIPGRRIVDTSDRASVSLTGDVADNVFMLVSTPADQRYVYGSASRPSIVAVPDTQPVAHGASSIALTPVAVPISSAATITSLSHTDSVASQQPAEAAAPARGASSHSIARTESGASSAARAPTIARAESTSSQQRAPSIARTESTSSQQRAPSIARTESTSSQQARPRTESAGRSQEPLAVADVQIAIPSEAAPNVTSVQPRPTPASAGSTPSSSPQVTAASSNRPPRPEAAPAREGSRVNFATAYETALAHNDSETSTPPRSRRASDTSDVDEYTSPDVRHLHTRSNPFGQAPNETALDTQARMLGEMQRMMEMLRENNEEIRRLRSENDRLAALAQQQQKGCRCTLL